MGEPSAQYQGKRTDEGSQDFDVLGFASLVAVACAVLMVAGFTLMGLAAESGPGRWEGAVWGMFFSLQIVPIGALAGLLGLLKWSIDKKTRLLSVWGLVGNGGVSAFAIYFLRVELTAIPPPIAFLIGVFLAVSWATMLEFESPKRFREAWATINTTAIVVLAAVLVSNVVARLGNTATETYPEGDVGSIWARIAGASHVVYGLVLGYLWLLLLYVWSGRELKSE